MASLEAGSMEEFVSGGDIFPTEARMKLIRQESVTDNPLTRDVIYTQRFILHDGDKREDFLRNVHDYVDKMLNDEKFGIVFFKARVFSNKHIDDKDSLPADDKPVVDYRLDFHTFAEENLTDTKVQTIKKEFLPRLLVSSTDNSKPLAKLQSTDIITHEDTSLRKPRYPPKFVHFFTIPINIILFFMFFAQFKLPGAYIEDTVVRRGPFAFPTNWSYLPLGILLLLYIIMGFIRKCKTWGIATAVVIAMLWGIGNIFYEDVRFPKDSNDTGVYKEHWLNPVYLPYNPIIWSYIVSMIQALSHLTVPQMPPYITGLNHWESMHVFLWRYNGPRQCYYKCLAFICFPILSVSVAYFSWPHLIGTQVFYIMAGIGYDHSYFHKYKRIIQKAELSGNPNVDVFPSSADTLMNAENPYIRHLKAHGILGSEDKITEAKVAKEVASYHIYNCYFRGRHMAADYNERYYHIYPYKAVSDYYFGSHRK